MSNLHNKLSPNGSVVYIKFCYALWLLGLADEEDVPYLWRTGTWREYGEI